MSADTQWSNRNYLFKPDNGDRLSFSLLQPRPGILSRMGDAEALARDIELATDTFGGGGYLYLDIIPRRSNGNIVRNALHLDQRRKVAREVGALTVTLRVSTPMAEKLLQQKSYRS